MSWENTYPPGGFGPQDTINSHTPGQKIAEAITEIQDKAVVSADLDAGTGLKGDASIQNNHLQINISLEKASPDTGGGDGDGLPDGGEEYQVLQRDSDGNAVWDWVRMHD